MPTGIPNRKPMPGSELDRLTMALHELHERLKVERVRDKMRRDLGRFLARRPMLTRRDVLDVAAKMKAQRGAAPVVSNKASLATAAGRVAHPAMGKVGKAIRKARLAKELTTTQLAEKINVSHGSISAWERGSWHPTEAKARSLAKVLGIPVDALSNGDARHSSSASA